jgi:RNA polymerase-binding transcription factor DksA
LSTTAKLTVAQHRANLAALRASTLERLDALQRGYDELATAGEDVGAGDDEGGSEGDSSAVERDRLRAQISDERDLLEGIDAALTRAEGRGWQLCSICGGPIGDERLDALPTTEVCVTCKARKSW